MLSFNAVIALDKNYEMAWFWKGWYEDKLGLYKQADERYLLLNNINNYIINNYLNLFYHHLFTFLIVIKKQFKSIQKMIQLETTKATHWII